MNMRWSLPCSGDDDTMVILAIMMATLWICGGQAVFKCWQRIAIVNMQCTSGQTVFSAMQWWICSGHAVFNARLVGWLANMVEAGCGNRQTGMRIGKLRKPWKLCQLWSSRIEYKAQVLAPWNMNNIVEAVCRNRLIGMMIMMIRMMVMMVMMMNGFELSHHLSTVQNTNQPCTLLWVCCKNNNQCRVLDTKVLVH